MVQNHQQRPTLPQPLPDVQVMLHFAGARSYTLSRSAICVIEVVFVRPALTGTRDALNQVSFAECNQTVLSLAFVFSPEQLP